MSRLLLAVLPSNQDGNPVVGGGNEMDHIRRLAAAVLAAAHEVPSITAMLFTGAPQSLDYPAGSLSGLAAQQREAAAWIARTRQPGDLTVALNLHSDSGAERHCGYYYDPISGPVSEWLGRALADAIKGWFGSKVYSADYGTIPVGGGLFGYPFARLLRDIACPVLIESGTHTIAKDVAAVRDHSAEIGKMVVGTLAGFFGLETAPALNVSELRSYPEWSLARLAHAQDSRDRGAFAAHLEAIGCDTSDLSRWGWPS